MSSCSTKRKVLSIPEKVCVITVYESGFKIPDVSREKQ